MSEKHSMSPLAVILMRVLRAGAWGAACLVAVFAAILLWQRWSAEGTLVLSRQDYGLLCVLALLFGMALYLVRGIKRELDASN